MKIFVDTSAWIALELNNDQWHQKAVECHQKYRKTRSIFYTNNYVLSEVYTRLIYDVHLKSAYTFHEQIASLLFENQLVLLEVGHIERENTWKQLLKYSDHKLSFTDGTIVAQVKELGLDQIFTFDRHFKDINLGTNL